MVAVTIQQPLSLAFPYSTQSKTFIGQELIRAPSWLAVVNSCYVANNTLEGYKFQTENH